MRPVAVLVTLTVALWCNAAGAARGPAGTFKGESGQLKLKYLGEGTVAVQLKTKLCTLKSESGATFVFPSGIHVVNKKQEPVLVIFYQRGSVVVYGELPAFKRDHCKGGQDATGRYKRVR